MPRQRPAWSWNPDSTETAVVPSSGLFRSINRRDAFGQSSGRGIKVAVIDSGIDNNHPAIDGAVRGWCEPSIKTNGDIYFNEKSHRDLSGHGTACAGIIHDIAPDAELYSVRVLGQRMSGKGKIFASGLRWAIDNHMNVINLSLGTSSAEHFSQFHELVDEAYYRRIVLVTAANNMPIVSFPSLYSTVISTACYDGATGTDPLDFYYNPQPPVEFGANGIDREVAWLDGRYVRATGNSFAAPNMTGIVALLLSKHPSLTPFQVKSILRSLANNAASND